MRRMIDPTYQPTAAEWLERASYNGYTMHCIERGFVELAFQFASSQAHCLRFTEHAHLLEA